MSGHDVNLGQNPADDATRDAIHVAVVPLISGSDYLYPGTEVKLSYGTKDVAIECNYDRSDVIGIVDPFRSPGNYVPKGGRFWCFLMPNTVTGMRHHWQHPVFDGEVAKPSSEHELWLRQFCEEWGINYGDMLDNATSRGRGWRSVVAVGSDLHSASELGSDHELFWQHLEGLMGETYDESHRDNLTWSCSC